MARVTRTSASCILRLSFMRSAWQLVCCRHKGHLRQPIAFHISICAQTLQKRRVQPQTANAGKSPCWGSVPLHQRRRPSHCALVSLACTTNTPMFDDAHESFLTLGRCQFSLFVSAPGVQTRTVSVSAAAAKHTGAQLKRVLFAVSSMKLAESKCVCVTSPMQMNSN